MGAAAARYGSGGGGGGGGGGGHRHVALLNVSTRKKMIHKIRVLNAATEAVMYEGSKTAEAFVPRLRPRSATVQRPLSGRPHTLVA